MSPGTVYFRANRPALEGYIAFHGIEKLAYAIEQRGQTAPQQSADILRVEYAPSSDPQMLRSLGELNRGAYAEALRSLQQVIRRPTTQHDLLQAHIGTIRAHIALEAYAEAQSAIDTFLSEFPNDYYVLNMYQFRFDIALAQKQYDQAQAVLDEVQAKAQNDWFKKNEFYSKAAMVWRNLRFSSVTGWAWAAR